MKIYLYIAIIVMLFAIATLRNNKIEPYASASALELSQKDTSTEVTFLRVLDDLCLEVYIGEPLDLSKHDVIALLPNYQEREDSVTAPLFSRSKEHSTTAAIWLNTKKVSFEVLGIDPIWSSGNLSTELLPYLQNLTLAIKQTESNVKALKFRIKPIDSDSFILDDLQIIYNSMFEWDSLEFTIENQEYKEPKKLYWIIG